MYKFFQIINIWIHTIRFCLQTSLYIYNLYGWAMSQNLPSISFKWVENPTEIDINTVSLTSEIGYVFEVDIKYPTSLHDLHNNLPFCAENKKPPQGKTQILMLGFEAKTNYIIHYRNLQQCIENGLEVTKVHKAIQFKQSDWLQKYINLNT